MTINAHGYPAVTIQSKKFGPVRFDFHSTSKGYANFDTFTLRGVKYKGYVQFNAEPRAKNPDNCALRNEGGVAKDGKHNVWSCDQTHFRPVVTDYRNSYLRRTAGGMDDRMTDAARSEVDAFIEAEAKKLFDDADFMKAVHLAEVQRMADADAIELANLHKKACDLQRRLDERNAQLKTGAPFCLRDPGNGYPEVCMLPKGHREAHEYARR